MLIIILILLLIALVSLFFNRQRVGILFTLVATFLFYFVSSGFLTQMTLNSLQSYPPLQTPHWKNRNAILLLGVGTQSWPNSSLITTHFLGYSRIHEAARLYYLCKQQAVVCRVITIGGDPTHHGATESNIMARELIEIGIPAVDIIMEPKSRNTFENAKYSREIIHSQKFDNLILVTSGFHMRRSLRLFQIFNLYPQPAPSDRLSSKISLIPLAQNFTYLDLALHEYLGIAQVYLYNFMGWNPSPITKSASVKI